MDALGDDVPTYMHSRWRWLLCDEFTQKKLFMLLQWKLQNCNKRSRIMGLYIFVSSSTHTNETSQNDSREALCQVLNMALILLFFCCTKSLCCEISMHSMKMRDAMVLSTPSPPKQSPAIKITYPFGLNKTLRSVKKNVMKHL